MKKKRPIRIVIAENHVLLRQLIVRFLLSEGRGLLRFVGEVGTATAITRACVRLAPDLLLFSMTMLQCGGRAAIVEVRKRKPRINILVYSGSGAEDRDIACAIKTGANGHVGSESSVDEFLEAIEKTGRGDNYFCRASTRLLTDMARGKLPGPTPENAPTAREIEVLQLIANGRTSKEIACSLGLSVATIDTHRRNLMAKVHAHNAAEVIRFGREHSLLEPSVST